MFVVMDPRSLWSFLVWLRVVICWNETALWKYRKVRNPSIKKYTDRFCRCETIMQGSLKDKVGRFRKCGSFCAEWALCQLKVFHVGWGVGAEQATLTEGFPSWWVLRHTRHPRSLSSLFMETMKHHLLFYHDKANWQSRLNLVLIYDRYQCCRVWYDRRTCTCSVTPFVFSKNPAERVTGAVMSIFLCPVQSLFVKQQKATEAFHSWARYNIRCLSE